MICVYALEELHQLHSYPDGLPASPKVQPSVTSKLFNAYTQYDAGPRPLGWSDQAQVFCFEGCLLLQVVNGETMQSTGDTRRFCLNGLPGSVTVTLVWHDYPGLPAAAKALVNDLDLSVSVGGGSGQQWLGNGVVDRINNVERVRLLSLNFHRTLCSYKNKDISIRCLLMNRIYQACMSLSAGRTYCLTD